VDGALEWTSEILQTYEPVEGSFSRWGSTQRAARQISKPHTQDITYFENSEGIGSLKQSFKGQISALVNQLLQEINCIVSSLKGKGYLYDYPPFP